ncbi:MAG: 1-deoxy-D-xylulose-5-phosphate reductoisomerase, partial [Planctomycetota bacterium]
GRSVAPLAEAAAEFDVRYAGVADADAVPRLEAALGSSTATTGCGDEFLADCIADPDVDIVLSAATGAAGLPASLAAVDAGKTLALANKESMVLAGPLLMERARQTGARIIPVDSEHSAVHQALRSGQKKEVGRLILTASGGPFRTWSAERIATATREDALNHPTWSMGPRITVDSATMMNKALELIEARWLFDVAPEKLEAIVHPQSIVHSMVEFVDGSIVAQMGRPDMRLPIQYALTYPKRRAHAFFRFDPTDFAQLTFEPVDHDRFPALGLAAKAMQRGGTAGTVLNAANEVAVARFLDGAIPFPAIVQTVAEVLESIDIVDAPDLPAIHAADRAAREEAASCRI